VSLDFFIGAGSSNWGVSSLQVVAHRKPVLTLLRMRDILALYPDADIVTMRTTSRRRNVGSGGMRRSILATGFRSADTFYQNELPSPLDQNI
jgi:hypothetical protein